MGPVVPSRGFASRILATIEPLTDERRPDKEMVTDKQYSETDREHESVLESPRHVPLPHDDSYG